MEENVLYSLVSLTALSYCFLNNLSHIFILPWAPRFMLLVCLPFWKLDFFSINYSGVFLTSYFFSGIYLIKFHLILCEQKIRFSVKTFATIKNLTFRNDHAIYWNVFSTVQLFLSTDDDLKGQSHYL